MQRVNQLTLLHTGKRCLLLLGNKLQECYEAPLATLRSTVVALWGKCAAAVVIRHTFFFSAVGQQVLRAHLPGVWGYW
jgi:hypothetical protein